MGCRLLSCLHFLMRSIRTETGGARRLPTPCRMRSSEPFDRAFCAPSVKRLVVLGACRLPVVCGVRSLLIELSDALHPSKTGGARRLPTPWSYTEFGAF